VAQMARSARPTDAGAGLHSTEHIRLSALEAVSPEKSFAVLDVMAEDRDKLPRLWSGVCDRRELDVEGIEQIGLALLRTLETQTDAMIPLATLRSHDEYTVTHIANVALLAMALAEAAGLTGDTVRSVGNLGAAPRHRQAAHPSRHPGVAPAADARAVHARAASS